jgi:dolichol-phosphate mannosyltransferase
MASLAIICPVFREEDVIRRFHERLAVTLLNLSARYSCRIIYVLDPSPDATEAILSTIAAADPRVEVLVMSRRFGHQAALIAGMDVSNADAVVMLDSDLQHPPELILSLVQHWEDGADIVQTIRHDGPETAWLKRATSRWFYATLFKLGAIEVPAGAADFRLLSRRVTELLRGELREHNPFLRGLVGWVGYRIVYVPFTPNKRERGSSKYRPATLLSFALNGICSFSRVPLRLCIGIGIAVAGMSFLAAILDVVIYLLSDIRVPGWASLFVAVSLIGGVQLIFLGVLGEYVSIIFDEVKNRPLYLLHKHYGQSAAAVPESSRRLAPANPEHHKTDQ